MVFGSRVAPLIVIAAALLMLAGCPGSDMSDVSRRQFPLSSLETATVTVKDHTLRVWVVRSEAQQAEGLMWVGPDDIADDQGMLFVNDAPRLLSFWMKNTLIPLDIAYARDDGRIVKIWTMQPGELTGYPSVEPARFALEVKAGTFARLGVVAGDRLAIPADVLKHP